MSTEPSKVNHVNQILMGVLAICSALISIIFYGVKEDLQSIKKDVDYIKLNVQRVEDRGANQGDAINDLKRQSDYLLKTKQDKRKTID